MPCPLLLARAQAVGAAQGPAQSAASGKGLTGWEGAHRAVLPMQMVQTPLRRQRQKDDMNFSSSVHGTQHMCLGVAPPNACMTNAFPALRSRPGGRMKAVVVLCS